MIKRIILKNGEELRHLHGHPWVFDNEVQAVVGGTASGGIELLEHGEVADVETCKKICRQSFCKSRI
ncbi:MAG: hypothetical protein Ta2B_02320 [Termitinemataceae bacterium]|nr:MAG: hypothetical protein Ta2B_02320 [Termitinemataceae bacterium]